MFSQQYKIDIRDSIHVNEEEDSEDWDEQRKPETEERVQTVKLKIWNVGKQRSEADILNEGFRRFCFWLFVCSCYTQAYLDDL